MGNIEIGDIVKLHIYGPVMIVLGFEQGRKDENQYMCGWFNKNDDFVKAVFPESFLILDEKSNE